MTHTKTRAAILVLVALGFGVGAYLVLATGQTQAQTDDTADLSTMLTMTTAVAPLESFTPSNPANGLSESELASLRFYSVQFTKPSTSTVDRVAVPRLDPVVSSKTQAVIAVPIDGKTESANGDYLAELPAGHHGLILLGSYPSELVKTMGTENRLYLVFDQDAGEFVGGERVASLNAQFAELDPKLDPTTLLQWWSEIHNGTRAGATPWTTRWSELQSSGGPTAQWADLDPRLRSITEEDAPADVLAMTTPVQLTVRIPNSAPGAESADVRYTISVRSKTGVIYQFDANVGSHEGSALFPKGEDIDVVLLRDDDLAGLPMTTLEADRAAGNTFALTVTADQLAAAKAAYGSDVTAGKPYASLLPDTS